MIMYKLVVILVIIMGSFTLFPFRGDGMESTGIDSIKHLYPEKKYVNETKIINKLLERYHYRKLSLNDSLSSVILDNYLTSLDYNKSFFLAEDIALFEPYRYKLDDAIKVGDLKIPFEIYNKFQDRFVARMDFIDSIIAVGFDFTKDEYYETDRDELNWADAIEQQNDNWRKSLKYHALGMTLAGKIPEESREALNKRYKRYRTIISQYKPSDVYQIFMNAYTEAYDPHTNYFNPMTAENFDIEMSRSLEGIGARLGKEGDYTVVVDIVPGGPAYRSNQLHKDDRISGVAQGDEGEMVDVVGWRNDDVVKLIRGKKGTVVRLQVLKAEDGAQAMPKEVRLVRDIINLEDQLASSKLYIINKDDKLYRMGVITIPDFYKNFNDARQGNKNFTSVTRDVKKLITGLKKDKMDGLLIDLRRNGGGALDEAIELSGLFIRKGPVVQVRDRSNKIDIGKDEDSGLYYDGPLTVLINRSSASASEIFTGAIQDYKRGVVIGEQSFGKGTVQNLIDLNRVIRYSDEENKYGNLKITLAKYYRITGSSTQNVGVTPDIALPSAFNPELYGESSMPASLPWDKIQPTDFSPVNYVTEMLLDELNNEYIEDLNSNPDLRKLVEDLEEKRKKREITIISLNEARRREESAKTDDEPDAGSNPEVLIENAVILIENTATEDTVMKIDDTYLKESLMLLATIVDFHIG